MSKKFGEIAVEKGLISTKELETALEEQSKKRDAGKDEETTLIGYLLCEKGSIDESDVKNILKSQYNQRERYQYVGTLGAGGMGVVQLVQDHLLGRQVALKKIQSRKGQATKLSNKQQMMLWRLEQEASITAILEHPNIVPLYDMQEKEDGELQFTMRKIEGETFRSLLKKKKNGDTSYDENKLISIFFKICDAVAYAHSKGIIHRDLKPDNVMVGQFGEVYVMDWGIAKQSRLPSPKHALDSSLLESVSKEATHFPDETEGFVEESHKTVKATTDIENLYQTIGGMGTEGYMPPEQREDASKVTPQSDIYALGKILKECFTYLSPMEELHSLITPNANRLKDGKNLKPKSNTTQNKFPKDIRAIVEKATQIEPKDRYDSVQELSKDVENYFKDNRVSARDYGFAELLQKLAKRNKKSIRLVSITFILIFIALFFTQQYQYHQRLKQNEERLEYWREKLKNPEEGDREQALLEINKMKEIEIWKKLIKDLEEGTEYYLSGKRDSEKDEYYKTIVEILGWLENKKSGLYLTKALYQMQQKLSLASSEKLISDSQYIQVLAKAFADSKSQEYAYEFVLIFLKIKNGGIIPPFFEKLVLKRILNNQNLDTFFQQKHIAADNYYAHGHLKLLMGKDDLALEDLAHSIKIDPSDDRVYNLLGVIFLNKKNSEEAIKNFTKAIELRPKFLEAYTNLGNAKEYNQDLDGAIEAHTQAINIDPTYGAAYTNRASVRIKMNQFDVAIEDYDKAIRFSTIASRAELYASRGNAKLLKKDFNGAIEDCNLAIEDNPKSKIAYLNRSVAKTQKGDLDGAIEDVEKAIKIDSREPKSYIARGNIKKRKGQIDDAILDYNWAIEINPNDAIAYLNRGEAKQAKGDLDSAIADYNKAIKINPKYADAYCNRGTIKKSKRDMNGALLDYNEAIRLNPNSEGGYVNRSVLKIENNDFDGAIEDCNSALIIDPKCSAAYLNRGYAKTKQGNINSAIADYDLAIRLNPKYPEAYNNRGDAKKTKGDLDGAMADYTEAIRLNSKYADAYNNRGRILSDSGDLDGAMADYNEAIRLNSKHVLAYNNRGNAKLTKGDLDGAIEDYNEAIRLDPKYALAYINRGVAKLHNGDSDGAIADCTEAIRLNSKSTEAYYNRGLILSGRGDLDGAIVDYTKAISLDPKYAFAYNNRGLILSGRGDLDKAILDFDQAILFNSDNKMAYYNRGMAKFLLKQYEEASLDFLHLVPMNYIIKNLPSEKDQSPENKCLECVIALYRKKKLQEAQEILILLKEKISSEHPKYPQCEQMLEQIKKELNQ